MKKLLIISRGQFGYHTDIFKWCEYLRDDYDIEAITFDGRPKVSMDGIKVHYVSDSGNRTIRGLRYVLTCLWHILFFKGTILVCYFKECRILKWCFPWRNMILDIRTLNVNSNAEIRKKEDCLIKKATELYDFITIISEGTRDKISIPKEKSAILPLGADEASTTNKSFETIRMLYVGTLFNRDIHKTIKGLNIALKKNSTLKIHYDIIGNSPGNELEELKELVKKLDLEKYVKLHGYIQHSQLNKFFDKCNIGVSFVPKTEYYEHQPVTKTFEYILSGLFTIATSTYCNRDVITDNNGILIDDTPESFSESIEYIALNTSNLNSDIIRNSLLEYKWENVVNKHLKPILKNKF
ncbi:MAG: glycosyltransferase family 4 protein [Bacteroidales bacterium]|nr:glycosyltransferase family 4 protein [Bacteroidales bacterium]MBO5263061.1 glycosyltransferase [Bacteroidaceae bacterium]